MTNNVTTSYVNILPVIYYLVLPVLISVTVGHSHLGKYAEHLNSCCRVQIQTATHVQDNFVFLQLT